MPDFNQPMSRNEAIVQNMLGADNPLGAPQSRMEALLMQLLEALKNVPDLKYDDFVQVIKITDPDTTMGDMAEALAAVNLDGDHVVFDVSALDAGMYLCTFFMGEGYYRVFDLVTGYQATGFWQPSDKVKDILAGSSSTGKHYTMQWDKVNAQGVRLNDAAGFTTTTTNFKHNGSENPNYSNPFDSIYPWSERKLCNIDIDLYRGLTAGASIKDCVVAWEGDVNFSYTHEYGVWVYTPRFFGRVYELGNYRYFDVTDEYLPDNILYPEQITGRWLGAIKTLTIDGESKDCLLPTPGMPAADPLSLADMHTCANNYGATLSDIYTIDPSYLMMIVEYATMNSQAACGSGISGLYYQNAMHPATDVTDSNEITLAASDSNFAVGAIIDIGTTNGGAQIARTYITAVSGTTITLADNVTCTPAAFLSVHGGINVADEVIGSKSGYIGTNDKCNAYYRGEVLWANKLQYTLGAYRQKATARIWIAKRGECDGYDALDTSKHIDTDLTLVTSGYVKTLGLVSGLVIPPFCTQTGGNNTNPVGDYYFTPSSGADDTVLLLGGYTSNGAADGAFYAYWGHAASGALWYAGARPALKNP